MLHQLGQLQQNDAETRLETAVALSLLAHALDVPCVASVQ